MWYWTDSCVGRTHDYDFCRCEISALCTIMASLAGNGAERGRRSWMNGEGGTSPRVTTVLHYAAVSDVGWSLSKNMYVWLGRTCRDYWIRQFKKTFLNVRISCWSFVSRFVDSIEWRWSWILEEVFPVSDAFRELNKWRNS